MTYKQYGKLHKEMWLWLSENPRAEKKDWPRWEFNGGDVNGVDSECFACKCGSKLKGGHYSKCNYCPIKWPGLPKRSISACCFSIFSKWGCSRNLKDRSKLAKQIASLWGTGYKPEVRQDVGKSRLSGATPRRPMLPVVDGRGNKPQNILTTV